MANYSKCFACQPGLDRETGRWKRHWNQFTKRKLVLKYKYFMQFNWLSLAKYKLVHFALFCRQQRYKTLRLEFILWKLFPTSGFVMLRPKSRPKLSILPVKLRKPLSMLFCQTQPSYLVSWCMLHILFIWLKVTNWGNLIFAGKLTVKCTKQA